MPSSAIRAVAIFEAAKGLVVILAGIGVFEMLHRNAQLAAERLVAHMHLNPASHYPGIFIAAAGRLGDMNLTALALGAAAYCSVRFVEAYGLWRERPWAEWFAAISGAVYVPFEVHSLLHGGRWIAATMLLANVGIVGLMVQVLRNRTRARSGRA